MTQQVIFDHSIVFDTNIFKSILNKGNGEIFENFFKSFDECFNKDGKFTNYLYSITPFLHLEYLGQLPPSFKEDLINSEIIMKHQSDSPSFVFKSILKNYDTEVSLSDDNLRKKYYEQVSRTSAVAMKLLEDVVGRVCKNDGFSKLIRQNLAMDYSYRYPYYKSLKEDSVVKIHMNTMLDLKSILY